MSDVKPIEPTVWLDALGNIILLTEQTVESKYGVVPIHFVEYMLVHFTLITQGFILLGDL